MKMRLSALVLFSSLLLCVSSCTDHSKVAPAKPTQALALNDSQIINIMMTVDKGEVPAAGEAAMQQASPPVDLYAKYLTQEHQENLDALTKLAAKLELKPEESAISTTLVTDGDQSLKTLSALKGPAFDKAFINDMVKEHQDGLGLIDTTLLPQTKNPELKAAVEEFRNMVSRHLEKALEIQKTLNSQ